MARDFTVTSLESVRTMVARDLSDAYAVRKDRPHLWLQRACAWILRKLGAFYRYDHETVEQRVIRPNSLLDAIYRQNVEVMDALGYGGETLVIGGETYGELLREPEIRQYVEFRAEYRTADRRAGPKVMGLTVKVVPWMRGLVVVP